ncbi:MAG: carboxypeptidase-like regulatory domain-containing protein, partial [Planctomycetota bacterium]
QRISKERLEMAPAYSISGRLVDPEGQPFTRAWVRARHTASPGGEPVRQVLGARLESDGRFAIRNLPAGAYTIEVRVPSWGDGPRYETISQDGVSAGTQDLVLKLRERPPGDAPQRRRSRGSD